MNINTATVANVSCSQSAEQIDALQPISCLKIPERNTIYFLVRNISVICSELQAVSLAKSR